MPDPTVSAADAARDLTPEELARLRVWMPEILEALDYVLDGTEDSYLPALRLLRDALPSLLRAARERDRLDRLLESVVLDTGVEF